jgi:hypothetical protein
VKKQGRRIAQPAYVRKLHDLWKRGAIPREGFTRVDILHDDDWAYWQDKPCTCNPDVRIRYAVDGTRRHEARSRTGEQ